MKTDSTKYFVFTMPNGSRHPFECPNAQTYSMLMTWFNNRAAEIVRQSGITSARSGPREHIEIKISEQQIEKGELKESVVRKIDVAVPYAQMTDDEFYKEYNAVLAKIPTFFYPIVGQVIDCRESYEYKLDMAKNMVNMINTALEGHGRKIYNTVSNDPQRDNRINQLVKLAINECQPNSKI